MKAMYAKKGTHKKGTSKALQAMTAMTTYGAAATADEPGAHSDEPEEEEEELYLSDYWERGAHSDDDESEENEPEDDEPEEDEEMEEKGVWEELTGEKEEEKMEEDAGVCDTCRRDEVLEIHSSNSEVSVTELEVPEVPKVSEVHGSNNDVGKGNGKKNKCLRRWKRGVLSAEFAVTTADQNTKGAPATVAADQNTKDKEAEEATVTVLLSTAAAAAACGSQPVEAAAEAAGGAAAAAAALSSFRHFACERLDLWEQRSNEEWAARKAAEEEKARKAAEE